MEFTLSFNFYTEKLPQEILDFNYFLSFNIHICKDEPQLSKGEAEDFIRIDVSDQKQCVYARE